MVITINQSLYPIVSSDYIYIYTYITYIAADGLPGPILPQFPEASAEGGTTDSVLDAANGERSERRGSENGRGVGTTTEVQQKRTFEWE